MVAAAPASVGRYRVLEQLGQGGMGRVLLAEDPNLGRRVAVKLMHAPQDAEGGERFRREARTLAALPHPNIVAIHDFGFHDGEPFLVMEYLPGASLDVWLKGSPSRAAVCRVLAGMCRALSHVHQNGVLHRDVKPQNVRVTEEGVAKLVDFGLALTESTRLTAAGMIWGTRGYMAPETLHRCEYSPLSDAYSAALVTFEALAGARPKALGQGRGQADLATGLRSAAPDLSARVADAVDSLLAEDPAKRRGSLTELAAALEAESGNEVPTTPLPPEVVEEPVSGTRPVSGAGPVWRLTVRGRRQAALAVIGVALAALLALGWQVTRPRVEAGGDPGALKAGALNGGPAVDDGRADDEGAFAVLLLPFENRSGEALPGIEERGRDVLEELLVGLDGLQVVSRAHLPELVEGAGVRQFNDSDSSGLQLTGADFVLAGTVLAYEVGLHPVVAPVEVRYRMQLRLRLVDARTGEVRFSQSSEARVGERYLPASAPAEPPQRTFELLRDGLGQVVEGLRRAVTAERLGASTAGPSG